ncbi:substrate-binding domain-containing protein [Erysipelotrichaceae bacterium 51-3]
MNRSFQKKIWGIAFGIAVVSLILTAVAATVQPQQTSSHSPWLRIGVITKSSGSEYWLSVESGIDEAARNSNVSVTLLSPDLETNTPMQNRLIEDCLQEDFDVLLVSPLQSTDAAYIETARKKGIPIVAFDTRLCQENIPYIGIDSYEAGRQLAKEMVSQLGGSGCVGLITGNLEQESNQSRLEGMVSELMANGIEIAFAQSGYSNLQLSEQAIDELMETYPQLDGILATSAVTALGLRDSLKDTSIILMTFDAQQDALDALEDGSLGAVAAQSGYLIGKEAIEAICQIQAQGGRISEMEDLIIPAPILTRDTVEAWRADHPEQEESDVS